MKGITYKTPSYPSLQQWTNDDTRYDTAYNVRTLGSCTNGAIGKHSMPLVSIDSVDPSYCMEHIVKRQTMQVFLKPISNDKMPGGGSSGLNLIYCDFLKAAFDTSQSKTSLLANVQSSGAGLDSRSPINRITEAQDSMHNFEVLVLLES